MPNNNVQKVKIGGVTFNKADVKSSEVIVKDGKKINSVFLQDGTHVEFPTQSADNKSSVSQNNSTYSEPAYEFGYNMRSGKFEPHWTVKEHEDLIFPEIYKCVALEDYNLAIRKTARKHGCLLADISSCNERYETLDGIHPTMNGHKTFAELWIRCLTELGCFCAAGFFKSFLVKPALCHKIRIE